MLKIWGRATSSNVQKVTWLAEEIGLPYERIDIGGPFGGNQEPAYPRLRWNRLLRGFLIRKTPFSGTNKPLLWVLHASGVAICMNVNFV